MESIHYAQSYAIFKYRILDFIIVKVINYCKWVIIYELQAAKCDIYLFDSFKILADFKTTFCRVIIKFGASKKGSQQRILQQKGLQCPLKEYAIFF